jgi:hypothetical protein
MWDVAIASDLIAGVYDDHPLLLCQDASHLAQHGCLAHAWSAQEQHTVAGLHYVTDDVDGAIDGPPYAAGETHNLVLAVADGRDAVQGALDAGSVVIAEAADTGRHVLDICFRDLCRAEDYFTIQETRLGQPPQV